MGGGGGSSTVATLPVAEPLDLLAPETRPVECMPDCALPEANVSQDRWGVEALHSRAPCATGAPRRASPVSAASDGSSAMSSEAPAAVLDGTMDLPSDRSTPPKAKLDLNLVLTAPLFDPVDWSTLAQSTDGVVDFNNPSQRRGHARRCWSGWPRSRPKRR